jgi:hypothetical protein
VATPHAIFPAAFSDDGSRVLLYSDDKLTPDDLDPDTDLFVVSANQPPDCSGVSPSSGVLWPPNGKLHDVRLSGATDPDGDPVTLTVTGVTQDEPVGRGGDAARGASSDHVLLRAARSGGDDGRVYQVAFSASDGEATCTGVVKVSVPHSRARAAVDSAPPSYDSLGG